MRSEQRDMMSEWREMKSGYKETRLKRRGDVRNMEDDGKPPRKGCED